MSASSSLAHNPQDSAPIAPPLLEGVNSVGGPAMDPAACGIESSSAVSLAQESATGSIATSISSSPSESVKISGGPVSTTPAVSPSTPIGFINVNEPSQDHIRAKFASSPGYVVPAPSFSYSVFPRSSTSSSANQSSSTPTLRLTPTMPPTALQPPVPGHFLGNRPFSYTVVSHANLVPATGQQFQLATVPNQGQTHGGNFANSLSLQPPVPGRPYMPNASVHGVFAPNSAMPINRPFSGSPQIVSTETSSGSFPSENAATIASTGHATVPVVGSQSTGSSVSSSSVSSASFVSASISMPVAPSFTAQPNVGGTVGFHGVSSSATVSNSDTAKPLPSSDLSSRPPSTSLPPSTPVPAIVNSSIPKVSEQHLYTHYPSHPGTSVPHQSFWSHPHQTGSMQHPPFLSFPGVASSPATVPSIPAISLPNVQPPGVVPLVAQVGAPSTAGSLQPGNSLVAESSRAIDDDKIVTDLQNDKIDVNSEKINAWTAHKTEVGVVYYYNSVTGESTYEKPANFKLEQDNAAAQTTPVSWEKIDGTDWTLVTTNDGKKYYYDSKNKVSSWHAPVEILDLKKNQEKEKEKEKEKGSGNGNPNQLQNSSGLADSIPASVSSTPLQTGGLRPSSVPAQSSALDLIKKKLQEAGSPITSSSLPTAGSVPDTNGSKAGENAVKLQQSASDKDKPKDAGDEGHLSDSSSDSDEDDCEPSKEECYIQFKEMLKERGVAPFSKWEKELPKIVFDPRFTAISSISARRVLFDQYVRTRAEEERKEKKAAQKAAIDSFKQLLEEASEDIDHKTDYHTFKRKWGGDPRFKAVHTKEGELLLNEKVKACEEKKRALRFAAESNFKSMLKEQNDITTSSRWSRVKDILRHDRRYKAVKHEEREALYNEYISELKAAEEEALRAVNSKRDEQDKLKEREREMRKRKEREEEEMEKVKLKVRRKEAESLFRALLGEMIKDPKASWTESKPKLDKDPQGRSTNPDLSPKDAEKLFREHVKDLYERCLNDFRALLAEVITPETAQTKDDTKTVLNSWTEAKHLLKADPRYGKLSSKDRESLWNQFADDMVRKLKSSTSHGKEKNTDNKTRTSTDYSSRKSPRRSGIK